MAVDTQALLRMMFNPQVYEQAAAQARQAQPAVNPLVAPANPQAPPQAPHNPFRAASSAPAPSAPPAAGTGSAASQFEQDQPGIAAAIKGQYTDPATQLMELNAAEQGGREGTFDPNHQYGDSEAQYQPMDTTDNSADSNQSGGS